MQRKVIQELKKTTFLIFLFIFLVPYLFVSKPVQQTLKQPKIKPSKIEKQLAGRFMVSRITTKNSYQLAFETFSFERAELANVKKVLPNGQMGQMGCSISQAAQFSAGF